MSRMVAARPYRVRVRVPAGWWAFFGLLVATGVFGTVRSDLRGAAYRAAAPVARPLVLRWLLEEVGPRHGSPVDLAVSPGGEVVTLTKYQVTLHRDGREESLLLGRDARPLVGGRSPAFSAAGFDAAGRLWVGTWRGGLLVRDGQRWRAVVREEGSPLGQVTGCVPLGDGVVISAWRGLFRFWSPEGSPALEHEGRAPGVVRPGEGLFAVTEAELLRRSNDGRWVAIAGSDGAGLTALGDAGGGQLLVGTRDGFLRFDSDGTPLGGGLGGYWVRDFSWDRDGHLWVATWDAGAAWSDGERWRWIGRWEGVPDASVSFLHVDRSNRLWMGLYADRVHTLDLDTYLSLEGAR